MNGDGQRASLYALARPYLWWGGAASAHASRRVIAQVMNLATYDDLLRLEELVTGPLLVDVITQAEPGWFSPRSWEFWRGRLGAALPEQPPSRIFVDADSQVKLSFFGGPAQGHIGEPRLTAGGVLPVASPNDLLATKLKAILDRAETKDYIHLAALLRSGLSLAEGLSAFRTLFGGEPTVALKAIGYFGDGDLSSVTEADRQILRKARDGVGPIPAVPRRSRDLT